MTYSGTPSPSWAEPTYPEAVTDTTPDDEARAHPLHAVLAAALRDATPGVETVRVWGRYVDNTAAGAVANAWAGSPEDLADHLIRAIMSTTGQVQLADDLEAQRLEALAAQHVREANHLRHRAVAHRAATTAWPTSG